MSIPRYVRVNTILQTASKAIDGFKKEGWNFVRYTDKQNYKEFLETVNSLGPEDFMLDIHVDDLLIFHPNTKFFNHAAYKNKQIILQAKVIK